MSIFSAIVLDRGLVIQSQYTRSSGALGRRKHGNRTYSAGGKERGISIGRKTKQEGKTNERREKGFGLGG
jgi:hypothetical protein